MEFIVNTFARFVACVALYFTATGNAQAYVSSYQIGFGPHVGGGVLSNGATVRHTSGYSLAVERHWALGTSGLSIGPRFEIANTFVSSRAKDGGTKSVATYDNRFVAAGLTLSQSVGNDRTFAQGAYLSAVAGRGYSKLQVDESTARTFKQNLFGQIAGNYAAAEVGSWVPLKGDFGLNIAIMTTQYQADQSGATGTFEGDEIGPNGELSLTEGAHSTGTLDSRLTMRTVAAKIGLALGF